MIEVVALHNHIVELQEGKTFFHTLFVALCTEHVVDAEACTYLTEQFYIVQVQQPVCVVEHHSFSLAELDETLHLTFEALCVVVDLLAGQHFSHIGSSGRVTDHGGAAADQGDRFVSCHLHPFHQGQCHEVTCSQTVCGAVESDIERCFSIVYQVSDFIFVGYLCQKASGDQFVINLHFVFLLFSVDFRVCVTVWDQSFLYKKTPVLSDSKDESPYLPCYHLTSQLSHGSCLCRYPKPLNTLTL